VQDVFNAILQGTPADIPSLLQGLNDQAAQAIQETQ
jgi:hypothetical protein